MSSCQKRVCCCIAGGLLLISVAAPVHAAEDRTETRVGTNERLRELLEERYDILKGVVEQKNRLLRSGRGSPGEVAAATVAMLHAEADLCTTDMERIKIHEKLVATLRKQEDLVARQYSAGYMTQVEVVKSKLARLEAQIDLEKLRVKHGAAQAEARETGDDPAPAKSESSLTAEHILNILRDQEARINDIYMDFDCEQTRYPENGPKSTKRERIMYMAKGKLFRTRMQVLQPGVPNGVSNDREYSADGTRKYYCNRTGPRPNGQVRNATPEEGDIRHRWGGYYLRCVYRMPREKGRRGREYNLIGALEEDKNIEVTEEFFDGRKTVVLTRPGERKIYLDPALNFAVLATEPVGNSILRVRNSNFVEVTDGIWMPLQTERTNRLDSDPTTRKTKVNKLKVNNGFSEDDFRIRYGPGVRVSDRDLGEHVILPAAKLDRSVLGELLDMVDGHDFINLPSRENKALLVCFWDMEQRPSRGIVEGLARRADKLHKTRVDVVLADASGADVGKLSNWLDSRKIPFACGRIKNDTEKIRLRWGVNVYPWLILADTNGVVQTERFTLEQLDEKLNQKAEPND